MAEHTVLFVDDEANVLSALKRLFRKAPYRTLLAGSAREALALIEGGERPSVIVSDQRMPDMNGAEFLARVREALPNSIRMMLTGYSDIDAAMDAINRGGVFRYILKPWDAEDLRLAVRNAVEHYELISQNRTLTEELKEKNHILEDLNANLEQKVEERPQALREAYEKNLALTAQLQRKVKELEGWDRIQQHLLTIHPLDETLRTVLEVIVEVVVADSAAIHLVEGSDGALSPVAAIDGAGNMVSDAGLQALTGRAIYGETLKKALVREVPVNVQPAAGGGERDGVPPFAAIPILKGGEHLGVIEVGRSQGGKPISEEDLHTILSFAGQAAVAIGDSQIKVNMPKGDASLKDVLKEFQTE